MKADAISGYRIERLIGKGAMASVYLATQESLDRHVALKVLRNPDSPTFSERFINEGRLIASLSHANIVTVYDVGIFEDRHYISMEYVEGGDLKDRIASGISSNRALEIVEDIAACLEFAHEHHVIHRDVKPANILFRADHSPVLTDFGIAKQFKTDTELTLTGTTIGTPYYISPEQAQAETVDGRADIYSLGIILYEMLMGEKPYVGESDIATLLMHVREPIPRLPTAYKSYHILLDRMIAKNPEHRFPDAGAVVNVIKAFRSSIPEDAVTSRIEVKASLGRYFKGPSLRPVFSKLLANAKKSGFRVGSLLQQANISILRAKLCNVAWPQRLVAFELGSLRERFKLPGLRLSLPNVLDQKKIGLALGSLLLIFIAALTYSYNKQPNQDLAEIPREQGKKNLPTASEGRVKDKPLETKKSLPDKQVETIDQLSRQRDVTANTANESDNPLEDTEQVVQDSDQSIESSDQEIQRLLNQAQESLESYQLTTPQTTSALHYYEEVLELDPNNKDATQGYSEIAQRYSWLATQRIDQGDYATAKEYINRGLQVDPGNPSLTALSLKVYEPHKKATQSPNQGPLEGFWDRMKGIFK